MVCRSGRKDPEAREFTAVAAARRRASLSWRRKLLLVRTSIRHRQLRMAIDQPALHVRNLTGEFVVRGVPADRVLRHLISPRKAHEL